MSMSELLRVEHMSVSYYGREAVRDVHFSLEEGEILGIVGESGSGKSTIIKGIMGLLGSAGMVTKGDVWYKGRKILDLPEKERRKLLGPEMGMVFQDCKAALCPVRTIGAQLYESMRAHGRYGKAEVWRQAAEIMKKTGLTDPKRVWDSYPFELSGGMNQRVGICAAMLPRPKLLLADEPTSALDVTVQKQVVSELLLMRREYHTAMILVTHNIGIVRAMADKVLVLQNGNVMEYGDSRMVLERPENPYTRQLMDSVLNLKRKAG